MYECALFTIAAFMLVCLFAKFAVRVYICVFADILSLCVYLCVWVCVAGNVYLYFFLPACLCVGVLFRLLCYASYPEIYLLPALAGGRGCAHRNGL